MVIKTIHIIPIVFLLEIAILYFFDLSHCSLKKLLPAYTKILHFLTLVIDIIFVFYFSLFGFLHVGKAIERLGCQVDVGGHNAYGAVFFMFFVVNILGGLIILHFYEKQQTSGRK